MTEILWKVVLYSLTIQFNMASIFSPTSIKGNFICTYYKPYIINRFKKMSKLDKLRSLRQIFLFSIEQHLVYTVICKDRGVNYFTF